ncbi:hypothetical protein GobsT_43290 [Gemmata obscuriglobus]|uniref:DUF1501 domain-containing protein n=1 Tax=Gemmata obscuriglobus TaxID=114 RepID=A0A2Z3HCU2_9BACT|nr:DUF1501 domain-containing protein [Gemmata obscuriglobus]AWM42222.1 DUF1501 domain-containing protein [Gemmata obscuriglobus]QEG29533.1 hypothetical protein GobsT_43290 [Gemmata obscuriglobus]VTS08739.1 protein containing duf1501 : Uncharacterized protein OS=Singulisphaera acidiphila (strain ATCC BAA-1392 / DSM 18658 / VKM B-2454 / MOB10) GN=Sinac_6740 PE=4 SV=1: DUF1501 [Gemmata obscuriglobus UQM 2246]
MSSLTRRHFLAAAPSFAWLTPLGTALARASEKTRTPAKSVIVLWLGGGPSQLETFDPMPGTNIAAGTKAVSTAAKGVQLAEGLERLADQMNHVALVRSLWSPEGDHERGTSMVKTGVRPDPTTTYPSLGAVICHALPDTTVDIPRHVSVTPNEWPARGGALGAGFDAFKVFDPKDKVPDVAPHVPQARFEQRLEDLKVVEDSFVKGRGTRVGSTGHRDTMDRARKMMSSEQLKAFDISLEPASVRKEYGETPFGRGCLAARRLTEVGVRCVEVTLGGWDSHANNHQITTRLKGELDPAFSALLRDLNGRGTLKDTLVMCVGEFGRTPQMNNLGGRDHWPHNFAAALAGGGIKGGTVVGESDPNGGKLPENKRQPIANLNATVLQALRIDCEHTLRSPIGRTFPRSEGKPIKAILV